MNDIAQTKIAANPYDWPAHKGAISRANTALLIIDMQKDFLDPSGYMGSQGYDVTPIRTVIPGIERLLSACREAQFQVYHTREGHRPDLTTLSDRELWRSRNNTSGSGIGDEGPLGRLLVRGEKGHDIIPELYPQPNEPIIDKPGKGAFAYTDFELLLRNRGIQNIFVTGVTTDVCVHTTIREANDRGFDCLLVEDCCAASEAPLHDAAIGMMRTEGGIFGATAKLEAVLSAVSSHRFNAD